MMADCPTCGADGAVDYEKPDSYRRDTCACEECGARFEVDSDADWNGDHYVDCSTPGKRIDDSEASAR